MKYRVMEYWNAVCDSWIGYACLEQNEFDKWEQSPQSGNVKAFIVIEGKESLAEWRNISCKRVFDFEAATDQLPINVNLDDWHDSLASYVDEFGEIISEEEAINREAWSNLCGIFGEAGMEELLDDSELGQGNDK